jgi:hypothetical protein
LGTKLIRSYLLLLVSGAHSGPIDLAAHLAKYVTTDLASAAASSFIHSRFKYRGTLVQMADAKRSVEVERIQTGVRMEKRLLKVLKAVAELKDMSLGDLLEGIVLHAFEGKSAFSPQTLKEIEQFRNIYGLTLHASDSHRLKERK